MGNVTLTKMLFAGLTITFLAAILFGAYLNFATLNNASIEEPYAGIFKNISSQYANLADVGNRTSDKGLVTNIYNAGASFLTGTVNIFVTGLSAMGTFFDMIPIFGNILAAISVGLPWLSGLITLIILVVTIYVAMRYIQSVSNKPDLP